MGSTNYIGTFIQVAEDCPASVAERPPIGGKAPTVAALQYALIAENPYRFTSDDVMFEVHAMRNDIAAEAKPAEREAFFAKDQACLRSSPLTPRLGRSKPCARSERGRTQSNPMRMTLLDQRGEHRYRVPGQY
ncbi:hypothetical protein FVP60_01700 [Microbacterium mitrae]|uniref:Uncharacterized protein n=1 Tax=Microbacterium mitrae TaxID=664640 RepID=A0A5C8HRF5_9MICO|nr:DUF6157 family protein [Microbacterium mitrae]TXK05728.1 hypothetical protein FVP60_01700 [Microbacterium mitrae]